MSCRALYLCLAPASQLSLALLEQLVLVPHAINVTTPPAPRLNQMRVIC